MKNKIKELREQYHYTQQQLSEALNIPRSTLAMYETNRSMPNIETLVDMCVFFDVDLDYLLGHTSLRKSEDTKSEIGIPITPSTVSFVSEERNIYLYKIPKKLFESLRILTEKISESSDPTKTKLKP